MAVNDRSTEDHTQPRTAREALDLALTQYGDAESELCAIDSLEYIINGLAMNVAERLPLTGPEGIDIPLTGALLVAVGTLRSRISELKGHLGALHSDLVTARGFA